MKEGRVYHATDDIIRSTKNDALSQRIMITTHPQRWTDNQWDWTKELIMQSLKNVIKRIIIACKH
jgi:hypothetical protein